MTTPPPNPIREIEKRGEMIQLGVAAGSAAGLLSLLSLDSTDDLIWWAGVCFCAALPSALGRAMMTFTAEVADVYFHPVTLLMYPLGLLSCIGAFGGYALICFHVSMLHGAVFLIFATIGLTAMLIHAMRVRSAKLAAIAEAKK